jgi:DNA-binding PadR family transcriptional regulator
MMTAHAYEHSGPGPCAHGDPYDIARLWRAMSGAHRGPHRGRGRHREGGFGWWGGGFPFGAFPPGGGPFGPGRKARRGDIRTAALLLLAEEPRNGYQIMQEVEERSEGVWRPSPGSVYPALAQLEDEQLIRSEEIDGRKLFAITEQGRALLEQRAGDAPAPWEEMSGEVSDEAFEVRQLLREVVVAFAQVMRTGSDAQLAKAREVLTEARRQLYRILADGDSPGGTVDAEA